MHSEFIIFVHQNLSVKLGVLLTWFSIAITQFFLTPQISEKPLFFASSQSF